MYSVISKNGRKVLAEGLTLEEARDSIAGTDYGIKYDADSVSEYSNPELAQKCAAAERDYSAQLVPHRVIMTLPDRTQRNRTIMARNCQHAEDIARESEPEAIGFDSWASTKEE